MNNTLRVRDKEEGGREFLLNDHPVSSVLDYEVQVDGEAITCTMTFALKEVHIDRSAIIKTFSRKELEEVWAKNNPQA
ncbi:MAG: hypothetical protein Q4A78_03155 [Peptostreptococcaceae bacterium]|nr:hypothetical protein [Peptostreptococcaceae bacterium]